MLAAYQPSMFDVDAAPDLGPLAGRMRRHRLTRGAWVDHLPGWVRNSDAILDVLLHEVGWRAERRTMYDSEVDVPRLLRWYGGGEPLPHDLLTRAREELSRHYAAELGEPFVTAGMCLYRDGRDSVAWHGDTTARDMGRAIVATVSLGEPRRFLLRPVEGPPELRAWSLGGGDLLVMGGTCQRTWRHAVPKRAHAGPRIALMFRPAWGGRYDQR